MRYMAAAGYDPNAAVTLQETFVRLSEESGGDGGRLATLFASHPPSAERVEKNRETAATLAAGGDLGRERYQAATAQLRRARSRRTRPMTKAAQRSPTIGPPTPSAPRSKRCGYCPPKRNIHALLGDIDLQRAPLRRMRCATTTTRSPATTSSSTTTCRRGSRTGNCGSGKNRAPRSRRASSCCRRPTPSTRSARWPSSAATARRRSSTTRSAASSRQPGRPSGAGSDGSARSAEQSRQVHPGARRARQRGAARRRGRESDARGGDRRGRGRALRRLARRDPRARSAHQRVAARGRPRASRRGSGRSRRRSSSRSA